MSHGSDTCYCGDYRSQHNRGPNKMCFCGCVGFHGGRPATKEERKHWEAYHSPHAGEKLQQAFSDWWRQERERKGASQ